MHHAHLHGLARRLGGNNNVNNNNNNNNNNNDNTNSNNNVNSNKEILIMIILIVMLMLIVICTGLRGAQPVASSRHCAPRRLNIYYIMFNMFTL